MNARTHTTYFLIAPLLNVKREYGVATTTPELIFILFFSFSFIFSRNEKSRPVQ